MNNLQTELHLISPKPREFRIDTTTHENFIVSVIIPGFAQPVAMTKDELAKLVAHSVQQMQAAQQREQFLVKTESTPGTEVPHYGGVEIVSSSPVTESDIAAAGYKPCESEKEPVEFKPEASEEDFLKLVKSAEKHYGLDETEVSK